PGPTARCGRRTVVARARGRASVPIEGETYSLGVRRPSLSPAAYRRLTGLALVLLIAIVVTGAAVRLTGSGLGCSDWPSCEQDRFVPEWSFRPWVEFGNRLVTGVVSVAVAAAVLGALVRVPRRRDLVVLALGLVAGVVAQIILGALLVLAHLDPRFTMGHFLLSMLLVADAVWLHHRADADAVADVDRVAAGRTGPGGALRPLGVALVVAAGLVLLTGAVVTGSGPHGGDERADRFALAMSEVTRAHSVAAWLLVTVTLVSALVLARRPDQPRAARHARWLLGLLVAQGTVGYVQYATGVPAGLVAAHILGASVAWALALQVLLDLADRRGPLVRPSPGSGTVAVPVLSGG
ncbi:MAG: heme A synthase, partial [Acidimicrobiia bacterium]|nr:heme A synthase [Acidimicrobiia bacterium]